MNAAIRAVTRTAIYHDLHVYGVIGGYEGMINGNIQRLRKRCSQHHATGGTILKRHVAWSLWSMRVARKPMKPLMAHDIDGCIAIGGNGTYTGALKFGQEFNIPIIGLPGTIDNDIFEQITPLALIRQ